PEIEKTVRAMLAASQTTVPALADRARALNAGTAVETPETFLKDLGVLKAPELKQFGKAVGLELSGTKAVILDTVKRWLASGGQAVYANGRERAKEEAERFAGDLPLKLTPIDSAKADEIIRKAEAASRALS